MSSLPLFRRSDLMDGDRRPERDPGFEVVRRGVYTPTADAAGPLARYLATVRAAHLTLTGAHVFSHESAAVLLGVPILGRWPAEVHLIDERRTGGRSQLDVVRHCLGLEDVVPVVVDGMLVTGPARTAFDIALSRSWQQAVVVADAVLRTWPEAEAELRSLAAAWGDRRGWRKVRRVLDFMDGRSGSVGESLSRCEMHLLGFVKPELQVLIVTGGRREFGDFGWEEVLGLGEFDGEVKYRDDRYRRGGSVEDVVIREKNRENRLRQVRPRFARWDWPDLMGGHLEGILLTAGIPKRNR